MGGEAKKEWPWGGGKGLLSEQGQELMDMHSTRSSALCPLARGIEGPGGWILPRSAAELISVPC